MGQDGYPRTFTNLSVPSVIFADASWYGSLRGGVELGGDADGRFNTTGSRWGIQGSTEVSEGLSAVYKFETRIGSGGSASQGTNQLYAGLSGGFGNLTLGKFHNAAYNGAGAIRDIGYWYSSGDAASKVGNTVSYAFSSDAANFQVDAIMDSAKDSGRAIDEVQFGVSVNLGEIGKVGLGYENVEDWTETKTVTDYKLKSGNVTSDFVGDFTVPASDVSGGLEAEIAFTPMASYKRPTVPQGYCYQADRTAHDNSIGNALTTASACTAAATTNVFVPHDTLVRVDALKPWVLTESLSNGASGIELDKDAVALEQLTSVTTDDEKKEVMSRIVMVHNSNFAGINPTAVVVGMNDPHKTTANKFADDPMCVAGSSGADLGNCAPARVFFTTDDQGNETFVAAADRKHSLSIKLNDGSLTAGSATPTTDTREIDSSVDDLTVTADGTREETTPTMHGYKATHVSVQVNLGAMTLGLGYSEKESNKMGSMDQKTTFVGASGSIGDTGMGWRAWTRDISNVDNEAGDANPWGIGINKDLGGGAFTFVEHHDADGGASGNTIIALGVNF